MDYISFIPQAYFFFGLVGLLLCFLAAAAAGNTEIHRHYKTGQPLRYAGKLSHAPIRIPKSGKDASREMRGVWMATVSNIDFHKHKRQDSFQKEYLEAASNLAGHNFNAVVFQIRATNDAFYRSALNPWSRYLTGREGEGIPGFDPLDFMLREAHKRSLEFHAWLNPYRIVNSTPLRKPDYLKTLAPGNFARKRPELVLEIPLHNGTYQLILNPGEAEVTAFLLDTVREIVVNYDVDAIHFDDYFYPYHPIGNIDRKTYDRYNSAGLPLGEWRRNNVNTLIEKVHALLNAHNRENRKLVKFGISPFGIWANRANHPQGSLTAGKQSYYVQFADSRRWVKERWVDYIVPQLYWEFDHEVAAYAALLDWRAGVVRHTKVNLYIGQSASRLGSAGAWKNCNELADQQRYNSKRRAVKGTILFSYSSIFFPRNKYMYLGIKKILARYRQHKAAVPKRRTRQVLKES
ncbi:MAG: family 10 glycosylhydrolase [Victivallaceae bacterium]|nr:family 10 glycosylhydrolase [Victivallaceae bacterium]